MVFGVFARFPHGKRGFGARHCIESVGDPGSMEARVVSDAPPVLNPDFGGAPVSTVFLPGRIENVEYALRSRNSMKDDGNSGQEGTGVGGMPGGRRPGCGGSDRSDTWSRDVMGVE